MSYLNTILSKRLIAEGDKYKKEGNGKAFTFIKAGYTLLEIESLDEKMIMNGEVYGKYIGPSIREHLKEYLKEYEENRIKDIYNKNANPHKHYTKREVVLKKIEPLIELLELENIKYDIGGSYRRKCPIVGDIDILVWGKFPDLNDVDAKIVAMGEKKVKMVFDDLEVDLRSFEEKHRGCALLYFTGPGNYNVVLRGKAKKLGYKLNEYCLTKLSTGEEYYFNDERGIFEKLGISYYEPEEREQWR